MLIGFVFKQKQIPKSIDFCDMNFLNCDPQKKSFLKGSTPIVSLQPRVADNGFR